MSEENKGFLLKIEKIETDFSKLQASNSDLLDKSKKHKDKNTMLKTDNKS